MSLFYYYYYFGLMIVLKVFRVFDYFIISTYNYMEKVRRSE